VRVAYESIVCTTGGGSRGADGARNVKLCNTTTQGDDKGCYIRSCEMELITIDVIRANI